MKKYISFVFFISLLGLACAPKFDLSEDKSANEIYASINDDNISIEMIYIGATPTYHIFETQIANYGPEELIVSSEDFVWHNVKKDSYQSPFRTVELESQLAKERQKLKKEKKKRTIWSAVTTGLSILANSTAGISIGESLWYSSESVFYIFDERKWMQRNINSVEEELEYIERHNLSVETIAPNGQIVKDLLFPIKKSKGDIEIIYHHPTHDYILIFSEADFRHR